MDERGNDGPLRVVLNSLKKVVLNSNLT